MVLGISVIELWKEYTSLASRGEIQWGNFSGENSGHIGRKQYQEHVVEQQFCNEWFRVEKHDMQCSHEPTRKVQRKLNFDQENPENITEEKLW